MKYKVTLHGKTYEVEVERGNAILIDEYGAKAPAAPVAQVSEPAQTQTAPRVASPSQGTGEPVSAPMPGLIVDVKVSNGNTVKKGQIIVIIEAMKMENEILAPSDGTVTSVLVSKGSSVETGDTLVTIA